MRAPWYRRKVPAERIECTRCLWENPINAKRCSQCGATLLPKARLRGGVEKK